ncbi:MAG: polyamine aminopropyltransferase [Candidatus Marinimicrobia bacterium]|nr:polyamine aminopropyltransferase [Candidatus Neomarinimicrobiota bacterium]
MSIWFVEDDMRVYGLLFKIKKTLFTGESKYQKIEVFETEEMGRLLALDGMVMSCEYDEFSYHEMIAHVPLYTHPNPREVLIVGGGDGGTAREVLKHEIVESVDMVEIDAEVVEVTKKYIPSLGRYFDNPKLRIYIEDGLKYVEKTNRKYDIILIDGSDPVGQAVGLFSKEFYTNCKSILKDDGIMVSQTETPYDVTLKKHVPGIYRNLKSVFPETRMYLAHVACYPSGMWSFSFSSKKYDPIKDFQKERYERDNLDLKYYNSAVHKSCFSLPNFVKKMINEKS